MLYNIGYQLLLKSVLLKVLSVQIETTISHIFVVQ